MADIAWDDKDFQEKMTALEAEVQKAADTAVIMIADEVLRLSEREVPLDKSPLSQSGQIEPDPEGGQIVGYNKVYAAYQHEGMRADGTHIIRHHKNNRKGKYLEDPIKNNLNVFSNILQSTLVSVFGS
jgi:hypothetical protein